MISKCSIAEYGICIDDLKEKGKFRYMIAGAYHGEKVPEGMSVYEFPDMDWQNFDVSAPCRQLCRQSTTRYSRSGCLEIQTMKLQCM